MTTNGVRYAIVSEDDAAGSDMGLGLPTARRTRTVDPRPVYVKRLSRTEVRPQRERSPAPVPHLVCVEVVAVSEVEPAARHDRMRPARALALDGEPSRFLVAIGSRPR